jgi:nucleotide-binding universal stress UspA family protein
MDFPCKRILCAIDLQGDGYAALDAAAGLAAHFGAVVYLLYVVPMVMLGTETLGLPQIYESQVEAARQKLKRLADEKLAPVKYETLVAVGEPGAAILATADNLAPDLVVISTHGRKGLARLALGSVAERVVRGSHRPVLTVRPPASDVRRPARRG